MRVRVIPNAKTPQLLWRDGGWVLRVRAKPMDGKANAEVEKTLSSLANCRVRVVSGLKSRVKEVVCDNIPDKDLHERVCAGVAELGQTCRNEAPVP